MNFEGSITIQAPRERVWAFLTNPETVSECAPGVQSLEILTPGEKFRAVAAVGIGSMRVTFNTDVEWTELDPPNRARMKARGSAPGSAVEAEAEMVLEDGAEGSTEMRWSADVAVMGTIASLSSRMMGSVAEKLTGEFFECVGRKIEA